MECIDLESTLNLGDSEIVQVDFIQELQQNMSRLQKQLDEVNSKLSRVEMTTNRHEQLCICMNKTKNLSGQGSASGSSLSPQFHPEILRVDNRIRSMDVKIDILRRDLKEMVATGKLPESASSSLPRIIRPSGNVRKTPHQIRPPPPLTRIANLVNDKSFKREAFNQDRADPLEMQGRGRSQFMNTLDLDDGEDDQEEPNVNGGYNFGGVQSGFSDEEDEDKEDEQEQIEIQPEIMFDEYDDEEHLNEEEEDDMNQYQQEDFDEFDGDGYDDDGGGGQLLPYDGVDFGEDDGTFPEGEEDGTFPEGEEQGQIIQFRDVRGSIVQALAFRRSGRIQCPSCPVECMSRRNIVRHYNNKHAAPQTHECPICGAILNRKDSLSVHLKNQHHIVEQNGKLVSVLVEETCLQSENPSTSSSQSMNIKVEYGCKVCKKSFLSPNDLAAHHKANHKPPPQRPPRRRIIPPSSLSSDPSAAAREGRKCPYCHKVFAFRRYLLRHMKGHTEVNECIACGKVYSRRDKLRSHQREKHGGVLAPRTRQVEAVQMPLLLPHSTEGY